MLPNSYSGARSIGPAPADAIREVEEILQDGRESRGRHESLLNAVAPRKIPHLGEWCMFKPEIKVLDCSIRDGGLINNWQFEDELVRATYRNLSEAGVDYMEIGYKASKSQFDPGEVRQVAFLRRRRRTPCHRRDRVGA